MSNIQKHIPFVKEQIDHYDRMAVKFRSNQERNKLYIEVAEKLRELLEDLENDATSSRDLPISDVKNPLASSSSLSKLPPDFFTNPLSLTASDVTGLPEQVIQELNITPSDKLEILIVDLINAAGGVLILDKIIAGLYHITGEAHQRNTLTAKLYRMSRKGLVFSVPKKKGVYTTSRPESSDCDSGDVQDLV